MGGEESLERTGWCGWLWHWGWSGCMRIWRGGGYCLFLESFKVSVSASLLFQFSLKEKANILDQPECVESVQVDLLCVAMSLF